MRKFLIVSVTILLSGYLIAQPSTCPGPSGINFQRWNNINGTAVSNLTLNVNYPNNPSTSGTLALFELPLNSGNNFGIKVSGYICPPTTGYYTFWIASDAAGELWLSLTTSPANKQRIAFNTASTNSRQWTKYSSQKSAAIVLTAGQFYYVESLMKEGTGGDNMAVGWAKPGQSTVQPSEVIPGTNLRIQLPDSQPPSAPTNLTSSIITQTSFTLKWTASTDNIGVTGYDVFQNNVKINPTNITTTSYNVTGLTPGTSYNYHVTAKDAGGNTSVASSPLVVTTLLPNPALENFTVRTIKANQRMPHDLVYGPDDNIWYTERFAGTVSFVNPVTTVKTVVLTLGTLMVRGGGQDGLMGLALHPQFNSGKPYVYISYTYESTSSTVRKIRIARYTYDPLTQSLGSPVTVLENIPGSNDHNSARLAIGPDVKLYFTAGDMGAGQFDNINRPNNAQNPNIYEGKILRLNTEPDGVGSWIPADNPFLNGGVPTAVYTVGHRNAQGLVWGNVNGASILYSTEHGPFSDDEINIIDQGRNYGWPNVIGWCDGNYNGRTTGGFTIQNEQTNCNTLNAKEPIRSLFPSTYPPSGGDNMLWPSVGHSGADFYSSNAIPNWQNSLLIANLKKGTVSRYKLSNDGQNIISDTIHYFRGLGRFRDVVVSPDGLKIYVACDSSGATSGPTGGTTTIPANPGSILEFTYLPLPEAIITKQLYTRADIPATKNSTIDIYPNPASSFFIIYHYTPAATRNMELYDLNGRIVMRQKLTGITTRIETGNFQNGLYIIKVTDEKGKPMQVEKLIIQK